MSNNMLIQECVEMPTWLTEQYIEKSLMQHNKGDVAGIRDFKIEPAIGKGENYASAMFRVTFKMGLKTFHYIIKCAYEDEFALSKLSKYNVYEKEMEMYQTVLPDIRKLLQRHGDNTKISAKTIHVCYKTKTMIFEDLSVKGFTMASRLSGFDVAHAKLLLTALAKFHASTAVLNEQNNNYFRNFKYGMFNRQTAAFSDFYLTSLAAMHRLLQTWSGYDHYAEKLHKLKAHLIENGRKAFDAKPNHFNCLIHGDIWINNAMFTYRDDATPSSGDGALVPDRVLLVDYQFCCWASPTIDLHYFFNTSLQEELRLHGLDALLQFYYAELTDTLRALKYVGVIPTLHEFRVQYAENSFYAFISSCLVQPVMINDECEDASIQTLHGNDEKAWRYKDLIYSNKRVQENLRNLLPMFDRLGHLD